MFYFLDLAGWAHCSRPIFTGDIIKECPSGVSVDVFCELFLLPSNLLGVLLSRFGGRVAMPAAQIFKGNILTVGSVGLKVVVLWKLV